MASSKDLSSALKESKIRLSPFEEQVFLSELNDIDKKIQKFIEPDKEVRGPYELN